MNMVEQKNTLPQHEAEHGYEELPETSPLTMHLIAGAAAGIMEHTVMYPFDNIKTRMQIVSSSSSQTMYTSVTHAFRLISTTEGARSLWRGVMSVVLGAGPAHAIYFAAYEQAKKMLGGTSDPSHLHPLAAGAAGGIATIISDALLNPFDVVKQRMQISGAYYKNIVNCAVKILQREGPRAFYVSYPTTLTMNIPFQSIQFGSYEVFRKTLNPSGQYSPLTHVVSGGIAGAIASAITTPIDCAKTLLQTRGLSTEKEIRSANSMVTAFRIIYRRQGIAGFFRGVAPRTIANMPATAISWTTYEYFKWQISQGNEAVN
ncbi:Fe(2+) transporter [Mycoemilia scoparia]|uniref:Fe(2+) transporter n=1 Tax=Mycoemilia scoparia TaxID=417184 RepID=A0A9W8A8E1_9FUNG|nr:Fe(2+) transporter [Mycoemilia scoparia]